MFFTVEKVQKLLEEVRSHIYFQTLEIPRFKFYDGDCQGAEAPDYDDTHWQDFHVGSLWGGYDRIAWFRAKVPIPSTWRDHKLVLRFLVGPRDGYGSTAETQLYVNGVPLQAIDIWHEEAWLPPEFAHQEEITVALRAWSGVLRVPPQRRFKEAKLIWVDEVTEKFYYLADTLAKAVKQMDESSVVRVALVDALNQALTRVDFIQPRTPEFYQSVADAYQCLTDRLAQLQGDGLSYSVNAIGHSHIDMAWLWRSHHTREKARRTFSTMLHLMRQYPEFRYLHSSPQLYRFIQQDDPALFERIREKVAMGQWEVTGGTWVECDTNLPGGESLVRQILFGKRFIREHFQHDCTVLWMPDTFGFSATIPQLMKLSGLKYFASSSIHWSKFGRFPYDTFYWKGIDGSQVLVTFFTAPGETIKNHYNYNGLIAPYDVKVAWEHYRQKDLNSELLMPFGWGDGGGGPTREMLESIRAQANLPGHARVHIGKVEPYFENLSKRLQGKNVPVWDGELYQEGTHGVYTSQARIKQANRKSEMVFHNAEWVCSLADILTSSTRYPDTALRQGWERILHNQFHDILPGTSIPEVIADALKDFDTAIEIGNACRDDAQRQLMEQIQTPEEGMIVFNPLGWECTGIVDVAWSPDLENKCLKGEDGNPLLCQTVISNGEKRRLFEVGRVPSLGYRFFPWMTCDPVPHSEIIVTPTFLENAFWQIKLNSSGQITSLFDKQNQREVLLPGELGNVLQIFEDRPLTGEAWEIDVFYQDKMRVLNNLIEAVVEESGPLRGTLRLKWAFAQSVVIQRLSLYHHTPRIDFRTELDWHQHQVLLKAAFPVNVRSRYATYEIPFGNIDRPSHWNTPQDVAHFENPAQKWVDVSEGNYGVALLNDSKYGYDVKDQVLRITLHRSPTEPDPTADQGWHSFTYSLYPHAGHWRESDVVFEAYSLNNPLWGEPVGQNSRGKVSSDFSFAQVDCDHIALETVKRAEDGDGWIIRLYEFKQFRNPHAVLTFGLPVRKAVECNLLEESEMPVEFYENRLKFSIAPYEIKTFKVWF